MGIYKTSLACAIVGFFVSLCLTSMLARSKLSAFQDEPNHRSLHNVPTPRSGGLAINIALLVSLCSLVLLSPIEIRLSVFALAAWVIIVLVALSDDIVGLGPLFRFVSQIIASYLLVYGAGLYWSADSYGLPQLDPFLKVASLFGILWSINLFNFMDGIDGLSGGMAVIGFGALSVLGYIGGDPQFASLTLLIAGIPAGFLCFNFPPAKIFMGDLGSTIFGFFMGVFSLLGWQKGLFSIWVPTVIFSPFWVDASVVLLKRMINRERFWEPHQKHYFQRLVLMGFSHRQVTLMEYGLMLLCASSVVVVQSNWPDYYYIVPILVGIGYIVLLFCLEFVMEQPQD